MRLRAKRFLAIAAAVLLLAVFFAPEWPAIPVDGATPADWNPKSFWYGPWGRSGVHKGIDIFAPKGTLVRAPTYGIVLTFVIMVVTLAVRPKGIMGKAR